LTYETLLGAVVLIPILLWIGVVDAQRFIIPNAANVLLLCGGLGFSALFGKPTLVEACWGAVIGAAAFFLIRQGHAYLRGFAGLGLGDVKFAGAAGSWLGPLALPWLVLLASISALATVILLHGMRNDLTARSRIAFGPHLAFGLFLTWIFIRLELF
jgi:leader peptidase (prepilin peptidase) / N-methyltransferase